MESESLDSARDGIAERITCLAKDAATPDELKVLAEAYACVRFGEHGGDYANHTKYVYTAHTQQDAVTDYRYTTFDGDRQPKNGAGFSGP